MSGLHATTIGSIGRSEFEFECVREFSHSGVQLGASVSREERRERIRVAIMRENKQHKRWRDTRLTYAAAYQQAYGKPIELRRAGGEEKIAPMVANRAELWNGDAFGDDESLDDVEVEDNP